MVDPNAVLVCVVDALRGDMLSILSESLAVEPTVMGSVIPTFAFEPDAAFLCGRYPEDTDRGTHFWYQPEGSPFKSCKSLRGVDHMPYAIQRGVRAVLERLIGWRRRGLGITARIPFGFLPYFSPVVGCFPFDEGFCVFPTVFDLLRERHKRWLYLGVPIGNGEAEGIWREFQRVCLSDLSLVFLFIADLDGIGHSYGPESREYLTGVQRVGRFIERVYDRMVEVHQNVRALVFSDHGMAKVQKTVDIRAILSRLSLRVPEEYIYFLDSTLARFWFFNSRARVQVREALEGVEGGRWLNSQDREIYRIRYPHNRFGDEIWWADGGTLIFSNFWQDRKPVKGMHGYRREVKENHASFILISPELSSHGGYQLEEPLEMVDVFATLVDLLGIEKPRGAHGMSICRRIR